MAPAPKLRAAAPLLALALLAGGCRLVSAAAKAPGAVTRAVIPGKEGFERPEPSEQQDELMRLAERVIYGVEAADRFAELAGSEEARLQAGRWRVERIQLALGIASRPDTIPALLDLIVAIRLAGVSFERHLVPSVWGAPAQPLLDAQQDLEAQAWAVAGRLLSPEEQSQARAVIDEWAAGLTDVEQLTLEDAPTISEVLERRKGTSGGGLGDLLTLDPFAGLEPTTREIALARLFAERTLFFGKHLPRLTRAELELAALQIRNQQETAQLLGDVERVSTAAERFGELADGLPELVSTEREAAIRQASEEIAVQRDAAIRQASEEIGAQREAAVRQVFEELDAQREALVRDLETAQPPVNELLSSSRATLEAAERTAAELSLLVAAVDTFLDRFQRPEEPAPAPEPEPQGPPPRPFDITEYADSATRLGEAARELTALVAQLEQSLPEVEQMVDVAVRRGEESLDHALTRGLLVGLALIGAAAVAALLVRRLGRGRAARA